MACPLIDNSLSATAGEPVRFSFRSSGHFGRHNPHIDAGWWPRSRNLAIEVANLLHAAQAAGFRATRVAYRLEDRWIVPPRRVRFDGRQVRLSGYHNQHPGMVTLIDGLSHERLEVMVVSPEAGSGLAGRALRLATEHTGPASSADILTLARAAASLAAASA